MWEQIENAPKTGVELVVTDFQGPPEFARWVESDLYSDGGFWSNRDGRRRELPSHFMLIPPPLAEASPAKGSLNGKPITKRVGGKARAQ